MRDRIRDFNWSRTPLGPIDRWPQSLKTALSVCLGSRFPMMIWWGPDLINLYNDAYVAVLGQWHPDALGKSGRDVWKEVWNVVSPQVEEVMERGGSTFNERVHLVYSRHGHPEDTWYTWSYGPIRDESGGVGGLFNTCHDESQRVLAERERDRLASGHERLLSELGNERTQLAEIIERAPAFMVTLRGPNHVFAIANDRYYEIAGRRDVIGKPVRDVQPEAEAQGYLDILDRVYRTGEPFEATEMPLDLLRSDGSSDPRFINVSWQALRETDGTISGVLIHGVDVTAAVRTRDSLRESEARYRELADAMPQMVWGADPDGLVNYFNRRWYEYSGVSEGTIGVENWGQVLHPDDLQGVADVWADALKTGRSFEMQQRYRRASDGTYRWHLVRGVPLRDASGQIVRWLGTSTDVDDQRRVEEAARDSERRLSTIFNQSAVGIAQTDLAGRFIHVNDQYCRMVGRSRDELYRLHMQDITEPEVVAENVRLFRRMVAEGTSFQIDKRYVRPDGTWVWVKNSVSLITDDAGRPASVVAVSVDVTERKRAEAERERFVHDLAVSEQRRRMAAEAADVGSFNLDLATMTIETDVQFNRLFSGSDEPISYERAFALMHPLDRERVRARVAESLNPADGRPYAVEHRVIHAGGAVRWMAVRGRSAFDGTGSDRRAVSFDGTVTDVTDSRRAEAALAFERHQLELIFRESPAAMALWRGEDLVFERVNPEYQDLFRGRPLVGLGFLEALPEFRGQGFDELIRRVLRTGEPFVGREVLARLRRVKDGPIEDRYFDFSYLQVNDADGNPWGVYDHAIDVTDRVLARQAVERSEGQLRDALADRERLLENERAARVEVELAGRMKDEFLATLSHELRTPLSAILGYSQLLRREGVRPETLANGLATIERNARAQTQIIEDLLDMSRIISGKVALDAKPIDLGDVVRAAIETVRATAVAKLIEIRIDVPPADRFPATGDFNRLQQVFWNLLSNAIKFTPRDGSITIDVSQRHSMWQVGISDTGEGMSPEFLPYVFDRFRQADASTTRKHGGLGLGLSIVKQLVDLHGGLIRVRSDGLGKGSTFTVSLPMRILNVPADATTPLASATVTGPAASSSEARGGTRHGTLDAWDAALCDAIRGRRAVIIDDEPDARGLLRELLSDCGVDVIVTATADEALAAIERDRPDVLVSDIGMPLIDGYELIRRVRALPADRGGRTPAIALTAYARAEDRVRAVRAGFQTHVPKPVEPAELLAMIASVIR